MKLTTIFRRLAVFTATAIIFCAPATTASATDVHVNAEIPYPVPSQPAAVDDTASGSVFDTATLNVGGTCEIMTPAVIVSIWRNGQSIGSTVCQLNGTFSLTLQLLEGSNDLIPRSSNLSNVYGPDGMVLQVTYQPPEEDSPIVTPTPVTSSPEDQAPIIQPASDLSVTSVRPFGILSGKDNSVIIEVIVKGSATPFRVSINWGDGSTDTKSVAYSGTYSFRHEYKKAATYTVRAIVTDVLGVTYEYSFPVVPSSISSETDLTDVESAHARSSIIPYIIGGVVIAAVAGFSVFRSKPRNTRKSKRQLKRRRPVSKKPVRLKKRK